MRRRSIGKIIGIIIIVIIIFWVIGTAIGFLSWPFHAIRNAAETGHGVIDKTINAENTIYNYEWFKRQYEAYKAINIKIADAEAAVKNFKIEAGPRSSWTFYDATEFNRLNAVLLGLKQTRNDIIAEYNARSKMVNRSIFKTGDLPATLPIDD